ncbi:hypothetical protein SAMN04515656_10347 [Eubacterium aggregans]|uniref:Phage-related protein n=1 Tax=Eubacterium aggregans TaxID=81409 RepID=A0A1H3Y5K8_9FIRM|nr:hypothetical protein [Eubacterium aggregans]SEA06128.1 hypothetical protein SAMN04515656_10347 [Eubacterium aggregans]
MGQKLGSIDIDLILNSKQFNTALMGVNTKCKSAANGIVSSLSGVGGSATAMGSEVSAGAGLAGTAMAAGCAAIVAAAAAAVTAIVSISASGIQLASDLNEVQNVVEVTYGGMTQKVNEFAYAAKDAYGLSETMAKKYMGTYGAMSKSFGYTTSQAEQMSEVLTGLTGDVASFYNISQDEAYTKLKSVFTGETESLKDLGVVMTQNALDQYALQNGYGKTTSKMSEQEKVALRLAFVTDKLSASQGDYARTSDGWANQVRKLSLEWDEFKANLGQLLIVVLLPLLKTLNAILSTINGMVRKVKELWAAITGKEVSQAVDDVSDSVGNIGDTTEDVGDTVDDTVKDIKKTILGFDELNVLQDQLSDLDDDIGDTGGDITLPSVTPGDGDGSSYDGIIAAIGKAGDKADQFKGKMDAALDPQPVYVYEDSLEAIEARLKDLLDQVGVVGARLKEAFQIPQLSPVPVPGLDLTEFNESVDLYQAPIAAPVIEQAFVPGLDLVTAFEPSLALAKWDVDNFTLGTQTEFTTWAIVVAGLSAVLAGQIQGNLVGAWTIIQGAQTLATATMIANAQNFGLQTQTAFNTAMAVVSSSVQNGMASARDAYNYGTSYMMTQAASWSVAMITKAQMTGNGIKSYVQSGVSSAQSAVSGFVSSSVSSFASWQSSITSKAQSAWMGVVSAISGAISTVQGMINNVISAAQNAIATVKNAVSTYSSYWQKGAQTMGGTGPAIAKSAAIGAGVGGIALSGAGLISSIGGALGSLGSLIPAFASGGYVKANSPQLAMIGDNTSQGEIIAPEDKMMAVMMQALSQFAGQNNNTQASNQPVQLIVQLGDYTFINTIVDMINNESRRTGQPLIITT